MSVSNGMTSPVNQWEFFLVCQFARLGDCNLNVSTVFTAISNKQLYNSNQLMLTLSLILKLLMLYCVDATRLQANNRTTRMRSTLAPLSTEHTKKEQTHNINSTTALYSQGYKSNQLYRSFNVPVRERNMMIVCPVFIASSRLHLSVDDELYIAVNDAIFTTDNLKQIPSRIQPNDDYCTMGVCEGRRFKCTLTIHMYILG